MTLVIGQPIPLASQVCTLYLFNFLRFFSPRHFKGIDHIHMYATHNCVHMFNYLANTTAPATVQPGPLASQVPKCVPLQLSRSGDAQVAPQCNASELQKLQQKLGVTDSKVRTNILEIVKIECLLFAVCLICQSTYDAELEKIQLDKIFF